MAMGKYVFLHARDSSSQLSGLMSRTPAWITGADCYSTLLAHMHGVRVSIASRQPAASACPWNCEAHQGPAEL